MRWSKRNIVMPNLRGFAVFAALLADSMAGYRASVRKSNQLAPDHHAALESSTSLLTLETRQQRDGL